MNSINATQALANFQSLISRAEHKGERILIQRHGKPVVAIIGLEDLKRLEALDDAIDSAELRQAVEENDGFTTLEEIAEIAVLGVSPKSKFPRQNGARGVNE